MKTYGDVDLLISRWLEATAPTREPEHLLDDVLTSVERTTRRPAWRIPERWIPMDTAARFRPVPRVAPLFVALALLLLLAVAAYVWVGSHPKLPLPTGPADNGRIAYVSNGQLWLAGPDGSNAHPVTSTTLVEGVPQWSRNGTKVAFLAFDPSTSGLDAVASLIVADASGGHPVTIVEGVKGMRYVDMSADSARVAFSYFAQDVPTIQRDRISIARTDLSAKPTRVGDPNLSAFYPSFSPDGDRIVFLSDHSPDVCGKSDCVGPHSFGLHVMNVDGTDVRVLAHGGIQPLMDTGVDRWARLVDWSHDGKQILFTGVEAPAYADPGLYLVSADGTSSPRRLDTGDGVAYGGSYSPNGDQIAYVHDTREGWEAMVANADGSGARVIVTGISRFAPRWSPDGHSIAVVDPILGLTGTVRIVPVDGEGQAATIPISLPEPADDKVAPTTFGIDQISWQRLAP